MSTSMDVAAELRATHWEVLKNRRFRRFFLSQLISSLGDWIGLFGTAVLATEIGGPTAVGAVMTARVLPGFLVGPLGGVIADRWDRRRTMIATNIVRAALIFSLPIFPYLPYLLVASMALESLTLIWGPAKDAALPNVVPRAHLAHANSLNLMAVYAPFPLAALVFAAMATAASWLASHFAVLRSLGGKEEALALWFNSATFLIAAAILMTLQIPQSRRKGKFQFGDIKKDLVEGLVFVVRHSHVRPWLLGVAFTFTAAAAIFSLGVEFAEATLGAGPRGFAFILGVLGTGLFIGLIAAGALSRRTRKEVLFPGAMALLGVGVIALASVGNIQLAMPIAGALGFFAGITYSVGYSLMHESTNDDLRGRTFSAAYTVIRLGMLGGLALFPFLAGFVDSKIEPGGILSGVRISLWVAGGLAIVGGIISLGPLRHEDGSLERDKG